MPRNDSAASRFDDNRPENLQLWHIHQPRGASVEDTVRWARWFLEQYGEEFPES